MSTRAAPRSRWLDWQPAPQILTDTAKSVPAKPTKPTTPTELTRQIFNDSAKGEPTKPTEPFLGGPSLVSLRKIGARPEPPAPQSDVKELDQAVTLLNQAGVRLMRLDGSFTVGMWSDLDGPELRAALRVLKIDRLPFRYLDAPEIPMCYKPRAVDGEPEPLTVLVAMQQSPTAPWAIRDKLLRDMGFHAQAPSWAEWRAARLNRLFQERGRPRQPGRITAATVRHGAQSWDKDSAGSAVPAASDVWRRCSTPGDRQPDSTSGPASTGNEEGDTHV